LNVFITGATGFIGAALALKLAESGVAVRALCRSLQKAERIRHENIRIFRGDIIDKESLRTAMASCGEAYHLGALAVVWGRDERRFFEVNVQGTKNVLDAAVEHRISKVVVSSTAGVLGFSRDGKPLHEDSVRPVDFIHPYEKSKFLMERMAAGYARGGLDLVLVNPSRVYGPGLLSQANSATRMIDLYRKGLWRFVPGDGRAVGNYVYIDDVVEGLVKAMRFGKTGERYLLGGVDASYEELFAALAEVTGKKRALIKVPLFGIRGVSHVFLALAEVFGIPPPIVPAWVEKLSRDTPISSEKARRDLGYETTPLLEGLRRTVAWLEKEGTASRHGE
jgi:nucleoside-diphosphate-sugar epimerase